MSTVLLSGVGGLGGWALELLARAPGVDRIVTVKRTPWSGPSHATLAMLGSTIEGHATAFEHHQVDLLEVDDAARLIAEVRPDAVLHSATVQSPRALMHADLDPEVRSTLRTATFGMWLPWHLLPATRLTEAVEAAGVHTVVVNASFPDAVNPAIWRRFGHGPRAGAGNVEVCAARVLRYVMEATGAPAEDIDVRLVGSHALLSYGTVVPHRLQIRVDGVDRTADFDLEEILSSWPEPIDWKQVDVFSLFAASAVKNVLALLGDAPLETHVTSPDGLPGGYPATVSAGRIDLRLPDGVDGADAVATNEQAARWDAIDRIEDDGAVVYTAEAAAAMAELGYEYDAVRFDTLEQQAERLRRLYRELVS
jgi:hypothetical protein